MDYKLIAIDMDGTLLNRQKEISMENRKWIHAAIQSGVKVVLATGRPIGEVKEYAMQLQLDTPLIINNGSEIWKTSDHLLKRHELNPELIDSLLQEIKKYENKLDFWAHTVSGKIDHTNLPEDLSQVQWLQFAIKTENTKLLNRLYDELTSRNVFEISNSHVTNIEFNPRGISKENGLKEICELLGIKMEEVIAVGDSLNDISMIRAAGLGVAMGNAQSKVKEAADFIALSNDEDGVAKVIQRYFFDERKVQNGS